MEGVDRNVIEAQDLGTQKMSPSSWRAWIEIYTAPPPAGYVSVALLMEGVDRNLVYKFGIVHRGCRPPHGGRG